MQGPLKRAQAGGLGDEKATAGKRKGNWESVVPYEPRKGLGFQEHWSPRVKCYRKVM